MAENNIPYKVRAALLLVPLNTPMPTGAVTQSLWYICNELFTWADVYDTANHDERRAILQQFIKEIRVRKDYEISITLNASFDQVEQLKAVSTYDGAEIFEEISEKGA